VPFARAAVARDQDRTSSLLDRLNGGQRHTPPPDTHR
jgi:hypothetical protein